MQRIPVPDEDEITRTIRRIQNYADSDAISSLAADERMEVLGGTSALLRTFTEAEARGWPEPVMIAWLAKADQFIAEHRIP